MGHSFIFRPVGDAGVGWKKMAFVAVFFEHIQRVSVLAS